MTDRFIALAQTRIAYDTVALSYARALPDVSYEDPLDLAMIDHFVAALPPGARVLDAGCGAGRMLPHLADRRPDLVLSGVDLSPEMVAAARATSPGLPVVVAELAALPQPDGSVDGILAWYSIIHTAPGDLHAILREFRRALAPGGSVLVAYQSGDGERMIAAPYGHDVELRAHLHSTGDVLDALHRAGLAERAHLDRAARPTEKHAQGFVIAQRREAAQNPTLEG